MNSKEAYSTTQGKDRLANCPRSYGAWGTQELTQASGSKESFFRCAGWACIEAC